MTRAQRMWAAIILAVIAWTITIALHLDTASATLVALGAGTVLWLVLAPTQRRDDPPGGGAMVLLGWIAGVGILLGLGMLGERHPATAIVFALIAVAALTADFIVWQRRRIQRATRAEAVTPQQVDPITAAGQPADPWRGHQGR